MVPHIRVDGAEFVGQWVDNFEEWEGTGVEQQNLAAVDVCDSRFTVIDMLLHTQLTNAPTKTCHRILALLLSQLGWSRREVSKEGRLKCVAGWLIREEGIWDKLVCARSKEL